LGVSESTRSHGLRHLRATLASNAAFHLLWGTEAPTMKRGKHAQGKKFPPKRSLSLPDLDQAKSAVLNSLPSKESQRGYRHAIEEFITWYCSEPRLSQQSRCYSLSNPFGVASTCAGHHQRQARSRQAPRVRSFRCRTTYPGSCCRHPARQRAEEPRCSSWKLAHHRPGKSALAGA
jgi:hypothetical protein